MLLFTKSCAKLEPTSILNPLILYSLHVMKPTKGDAAIAIQWGGDLSSTHVAVLCLWQLTHRAMTAQSFHYRPSLYIQTLDLDTPPISLSPVTLTPRLF